MTGEPALTDVHAHFLTEDYVTAARQAGHVHPDGMPGWPAWRAEDHLRLMDTWGVGRSVLSISSPGTHFGDDTAARTLTRQVNDAGAALAGSFPDRFGHFATLPLPDTDGALAELSRALDELGSDGVTVETNAGGRYLGDARYEPLYAELDRRRAVVFVHPTSPPGAERLTAGRPRPMLEFIFDTARTVADLAFTGALTRWPAIQWVFTHGAGVLPLMAARMELFRIGLTAPDPAEPTIPDQLARLWFDLAGTPFPHQAPAAAAAFGTGRLLYGSDYCWTPAPAVAAQIASLDQAPGRDGTTWRALTAGNAARLFAAAGPAPTA